MRGHGVGRPLFAPSSPWGCSALDPHSCLLPLTLPVSSAEATLNRSEPGRLGMLCELVPSGQPVAGCATNLTCVPLPQACNVLDALYTTVLDSYAP